MRNTPLPNNIFRPPIQKKAGLGKRLLHWLGVIGTELHPVAHGCVTCRYYLLSLETRAFHGIQPAFPVDAIYTWVDGSDPAHKERREHYRKQQAGIHDNALEPARFRDNQELRYSLRALEQFAPWVRRIYIITDRQQPAWLARDHPRIRIVDHREFIPEAYLPTFNSHVIEAYLHNLPGLSEHYLYLNDDVFLARPCKKTDFFTAGGLPMAFVDWRGRRLFGYRYTKTPHAMSYFNTLRILEEQGIKTDPKFITTHGPYAQTRSNALNAFDFFRAHIESFAHNRFRTTDELALYSHALPLLLYRRKRLVPCDERYFYVQTARRDRVAYYRAILQSKRDHVPPLFFCINDVGDMQRQKQWRVDLRTMLESYYPNPSPFEASPPEPLAADAP